MVDSSDLKLSVVVTGHVSVLEIDWKVFNTCDGLGECPTGKTWGCSMCVSWFCPTCIDMLESLRTVDILWLLVLTGETTILWVVS